MIVSYGDGLMTEKRFKWEDVYKWEVPAFLEVMNGLHEKNEQLKEENEQLKEELYEKRKCR